MLPLCPLLVRHTPLLVNRLLPMRLHLPLVHHRLLLFFIMHHVLLVYLLLMRIMLLRLMRHIHTTQGMHTCSTGCHHLVIGMYPLP
jgi:hypothetical protein